MRSKCRFCDAERKAGIKWYNDDYCSGKCAKLDGCEIEPAIVKAKTDGFKATLEDYFLDYPAKVAKGQAKGRTPKRYTRRYEPECLNWGETLDVEQLKQAGLRLNREPIPGDWDYQEVVDVTDIPVEKLTKVPTEWDSIRAKAKGLGITVFGKKRAEVEAEIKEIEND